MKAMKLTSHTTAMDLMIEFPGNGVVPRERFSPRSQFFMSASSEEGTKFVTHRQMMENLEHVNQYGDRHGVQDNGL